MTPITASNLLDAGWRVEPRFRHSPPVWTKGNLRYHAREVWRSGMEDETTEAVASMEDIAYAEKTIG